MSLDDVIIACLCLLDDAWPLTLKGMRLRSQGPMPTLADREVITMEGVGASLGMNQDKAHDDSFRRYDAHLFPALSKLHRTTQLVEKPLNR